MNYSKLVHRLRLKAFDYKVEKDDQFSRILKEAKLRKIKQYEDTEEFKKNYIKKENQLLFRTS
jgi:hypothetical protein